MRSIRVSPYTPFYAIMNGTKEFLSIWPGVVREQKQQSFIWGTEYRRRRQR